MKNTIRSILLPCSILALVLLPAIMGCGESAEFTVGVVRPLMVTNISPPGGADNVGTTTGGGMGNEVSVQVIVTFSDDIDRGTLTNNTFYLTGPDGKITATISYDPTAFQATLDPTTNLALSTEYTLNITTGVKRAEDGAILAKGVTSTFKTLDPANLAIINTIPGNGAEDAGVITDGGMGNRVSLQIFVIFSEGLNTSSVDSSSFTVQKIAPGPATIVNGVINFSSTGPADPWTTNNVLIFTPGAELDLSATYQVDLTTSIESWRATAEGGQLPTNMSFTFETAGPPDLLINYTSPSGGAGNINVETKITVVFSEGINVNSVTSGSFQVNITGSVSVPGSFSFASSTSLPWKLNDTVIFTPDPPGLSYNTEYTVTLTTAIESWRATAGGGNLATTTSFSFTTLPVPPLNVESSFPDDGEEGVLPSVEIQVTFNADVVSGTVMDPSNFFVSTTASPDEPVAGSYSYTAATFTAGFKPDTDLKTNTEYRINVTTDVLGTKGQILPANFVAIFHTRLASLINFTEPASGETNVPINSDIVVDFTEDINDATVDSSSFQVTYTDDFGQTINIGEIAGSQYITSSNVVTFIPASVYQNCSLNPHKLLYDTTYEVTISTALETMGGEPLATNYTFTFETVSPPEVILTDPLDGATDVPVVFPSAVYDEITVTFDRAMDLGTFTSTGNIVLIDGTTSVGVEGISISPDGTAVSLTPSVQLSYDTLCTVTLLGGTSGVADADGNFLVSDYSFSFTTSPAMTVSVIPQGGVKLPHTIAAYFSRAVDPSSIDNTSFSVFNLTDGVPANYLFSYNFDYRGVILELIPRFDGDEYFVTIETDVKDYLGNPLPAQMGVTIPGAAGVDPTCGGSEATDPIDLAIQVPGDKIISVFYSDYIHPGSVIVSNPPVPGYDTILISRDSTYIPVDIVNIAYQNPAQAETMIYFTAKEEYFLGGTGYQVEMTAGVADISANDCGVVNFSFTADDQPPVPIGSVTPVLVTDNIEIRFDEDMCDNASKCSGAFNATNFTLSNDTDGIAVSGTITVDNSPTTGVDGYESRAIFNPDLPLPGGKNYTLYLEASVTDLSGNGLDGNDNSASQGSPVDDYSVSFITENNPPTVTLTSPTNGSTISSAGVSIMVNFSENIDPASVTGSVVGVDGSFQLAYGAGIQVYGCLAVSGDVVTFEPLDNLLSGNFHTVTILGGTNGVTDLGGTPMVLDESFNLYVE